MESTTTVELPLQSTLIEDRNSSHHVLATCHVTSKIVTTSAYPASQLLKDDPWISQIEPLADPFLAQKLLVRLLTKAFRSIRGNHMLPLRHYLVGQSMVEALILHRQE